MRILDREDLLAIVEEEASISKGMAEGGDDV